MSEFQCEWGYTITNYREVRFSHGFAQMDGVFRPPFWIQDVDAWALKKLMKLKDKFDRNTTITSTYTLKEK